MKVMGSHGIYCLHQILDSLPTITILRVPKIQHMGFGDASSVIDLGDIEKCSPDDLGDSAPTNQRNDVWIWIHSLELRGKNPWKIVVVGKAYYVQVQAVSFMEGNFLNFKNICQTRCFHSASKSNCRGILPLFELLYVILQAKVFTTANVTLLGMVLVGWGFAPRILT